MSRVPWHIRDARSYSSELSQGERGAHTAGVRAQESTMELRLSFDGPPNIPVSMIDND